MSSRFHIFDESDDLLLCSDQGCEVGFLFVGGPPDGDRANKVGIDMGEVELFHNCGGEQFVGVSE